MSRTPLAFMSYVNEDDKFANGKITKFREHLSRTVKAYRGKPFEIFQDKEDIEWGQQWKERINDALDATLFLIPIITPSFFHSPACREELERFLKREEKLGRGDLILPVYYFDYPVLNDPEKLKQDPLTEIIAARQREDWRELRHHSFNTRKLNKALEKMARLIIKALEQSEAEAARAEAVRQADAAKVAIHGKEQQASMAELLRQLAEIKPHLSALPETTQTNLYNAIEEAEQEALKYNAARTMDKLKSVQDVLKSMPSNVTAAIDVGELLGKALIWSARLF